MVQKNERPHGLRPTFSITVAAFVALFVIAVIAAFLAGR
jgi:hypothetical protein